MQISEAVIQIRLSSICIRVIPLLLKGGYIIIWKKNKNDKQ